MPDAGVSFIRLAREDLVTDLEGGREREMERERVRVRERERESGWMDGVPLKSIRSVHGLIQYVAQSVGNCSC